MNLSKNLLALAGLTIALRLGVDQFAVPLVTPSVSQRVELYSALASVEGAMLGFVMAATAILLSLDRDGGRLAQYRGTKGYKELFDTFVSGAAGLAVATMSSVAALTLDWSQEPGRYAEAAAGAGVILLVFHVGRCVKRLREAIDLQSEEPKDILEAQRYVEHPQD